MNLNTQVVDLIGGEAATPLTLEPIAPTLRRKDGQLVSERSTSEEMKDAHRTAVTRHRKDMAVVMGKNAQRTFTSRMEIAFANVPGMTELTRSLKG